MEFKITTTLGIFVSQNYYYIVFDCMLLVRHFNTSKMKCKLSNSQPVSSATLDSTRVAQIRIPWEKAEISSSQR